VLDDLLDKLLDEPSPFFSWLAQHQYPADPEIFGS